MRRAVPLVACAALGGALIAGRARGQTPTPWTEPLGQSVSPAADGWVHHRAVLEARDVDLGHLGRHTHANWVVFELPFDTSSAAVRRVRFTPQSQIDTDVAALATPLCLPAPTIGGVGDDRWAKYTRSGIAGTHALYDHGLAPTQEANAYAINVPTRVANAASCGEDALLRKETWRLIVEWESRDAP